jgi:hypothetical protein
LAASATISRQFNFDTKPEVTAVSPALFVQLDRTTSRLTAASLRMKIKFAAGPAIHPSSFRPHENAISQLAL